MRRSRYKSTDDAFYHIFTRVAGDPDSYPLQERKAYRKLIETIQFFVRIYCSQLAAFEIMGTHYHFIVFIEKFRRLTRQQLIERAQMLYGKRFELKTSAWSDCDWERFNRKLFDVSSLMQQINGSYGTWFNRKFNRRGHFWGDRFRNPELLDLSAVQECLLYIELNAVRAGLVKRPEQWKAGSARLRWKKKDQNLMPLSQIFVGIEYEEVYTLYRYRLYHRGAVRTKDGQVTISPLVLQKEVRSGFHRTGLYLDQLRFYTDGLAVGSHRRVEKILNQFLDLNYYHRRKNPISQLSGLIFSLREQRPQDG